MPAEAMAAAALVIQSLIALYLAVGEPFYGKRAYQRLLASLDHDPTARIRFYREIVVLEWALVFLVLLTLWMAGEPVARIGLVPGRMDSETVVLLAALAVGLAVPLLLGALSPGYREVLQQQVKSVRGLIPERASERRWYGLVALTAGICEEILFRGFLIAYLTALVPGLPVIPAIVLSGAIFGMAHGYQGWSGVVSTGILGVALGLLYFYTGSLLWPIVVHALIDLRVLAMVPRPQR